MWIKVLYISTLFLTVAVKLTVLWKQLEKKKRSEGWISK